MINIDKNGCYFVKPNAKNLYAPINRRQNRGNTLEVYKRDAPKSQNRAMYQSTPDASFYNQMDGGDKYCKCLFLKYS